MDPTPPADTPEDALPDQSTDSGVALPVPPRVRTAFALLERLAPWVGAQWAVERWCTPPAVEASLRMPPGIGPGEPVEAAWDGHRVAGQAWGQGPTVLLVHGWGGCRAHLAVFVTPLVEAGHRVVAFDLPAHNDSDHGVLAPGRTTILECAHAVEAMARAHGPARAVVAHSLGAKAAALAVAAGAPVQRLVFLAPMAGFDHYLDRFTAQHGFGPRVRSRLHRMLDRRLGRPLLHTDLLHVAPLLPDPPPLLVLHDPDDPDSPLSHSGQLVTLWPGARLHTTRGLGRLAHYRLLRHRPAITEGVAFIGRATAPVG